MPAKQLWGLVLAGMGLGIIVSVRLQRHPNSLWNPFFFVPFVRQQIQQGPQAQSEARPSDQK
ncbi:MAG: hypothetical protein FJ312_04175 [SAR202 cluster bacterium]|nr:hypothetical protein [SAR202 cluster bacterium]